MVIQTPRNRSRYIEVLVSVAKSSRQPVFKYHKVLFPPESGLDINITREALPLSDSVMLMQSQFQRRVVLETLNWRHLRLAIDVDNGSIRLVYTQEKIDHALSKGVLEVVIVMTTHRGNKLWD